MRMRVFPVLCGVALAASGCGSSTSPVDNLEFTVQVNPSVIAPGTTAQVAITVINRDARAVTIIEHDCGNIRVFTPAGDHVGPPSRPCSNDFRFRRLESNQGMVLHDSWDGTGISTSTGGPSGRVPAGSYELIAEVGAIGGVSRSAPVTVQVSN